MLSCKEICHLSLVFVWVILAKSMKKGLRSRCKAALGRAGIPSIGPARECKGGIGGGWIYCSVCERLTQTEKEKITRESRLTLKTSWVRVTNRSLFEESFEGSIFPKSGVGTTAKRVSFLFSGVECPMQSVAQSKAKIDCMMT